MIPYWYQSMMSPKHKKFFRRYNTQFDPQVTYPHASSQRPCYLIGFFGRKVKVYWITFCFFSVFEGKKYFTGLNTKGIASL
jgi:hypothetical protein